MEQIISKRLDNELIFVINKIDLVNNIDLRNELESILLANEIKNSVQISCLNDEGFSNFINYLQLKVEKLYNESDPESSFSNDRHVSHLKEVINELEISLKNIDFDIAISSFHLRQASYHLGCLTGNITTEHILDVIFKDFCIGK